MSEELDVIAVGAHPDDVEVGCGGTIAALVQQGLRVGIVDLTDGEPTPNSPSPDVRVAEAHAAAKVLGCSRTIMPFENRRLFDGFEVRVGLAKLFRIHKPKIVLGLLGDTPTASPDHYQATLITNAAVFYSRLCKWDDHFDGLPTHKITQQAYYSLLHSEFSPNQSNQIVVDIGATLKQKMESLRCYATQFPPEKQYVFERAEAIARAVGTAAGLDAGEVITSARPLATSNLAQALIPGWAVG